MLHFLNKDITKKLPNLCINCKYLIKNEIGEDKRSKCKLFGSIDLFDGKIDYDLSQHIRCDEAKCGKIGKYYEPK